MASPVPTPEQLKYIQEHKVMDIMEFLVSGLFTDMPSDPAAWIVHKMQSPEAKQYARTASPTPALKRGNSIARPNYYQPEVTDIMHAADFNKGTCFTSEDRKKLHLEGLLPDKVENLDTQTKRTALALFSKGSNIEKYAYLASIKDTNGTLFYNLVLQNLTACLPLLYTPTVGEACQQFDKLFHSPQGMYISSKHKGMIRQVLDNWTPEVDIIVVTDGSRILGLGDLGTNGMGIPIGKLSLYVAAAGFHPARTLPIQLDCGTNNQELRDSEYYLGTKMPRMADEDYYPFVDEFLLAVKDKWPTCLLQFEDFSNDHCFELLDRYRDVLPSFNDDIQGTGSVIAAGFLSAAKATGIPLKEQKIVFMGAGSAAIGVADQIMRCMVAQGLSESEARDRFYIVDSQGLIAESRPGKLQAHKVPYARRGVTKQLKSLMEVLEDCQPTALVGLCGVPSVFTEEVLKAMARFNKRPIIFALSNPTVKAECTAEAAYKMTEGTCVFASGSPFDPVTLNGKLYTPGQGNNMYIFPGLGFGAFLAKATRVTDEMITEATNALADCVTPEMLARGAIYPPLADIRQISVQIAARVMQCARHQQVHRLAPWPQDLAKYVLSQMWHPKYYDTKPGQGMNWHGTSV